MKRSTRATFFAVSAVIVLAGALQAVRAQLPSPLEEELRRIFQADDYAARTFGPAVWFEGDRSYGVVERAAGGPQQLVEYDAALRLPGGTKGPTVVALALFE